MAEDILRRLRQDRLGYLKSEGVKTDLLAKRNFAQEFLHQEENKIGVSRPRQKEEDQSCDINVSFMSLYTKPMLRVKPTSQDTRERQGHSLIY